MTQCDLCLDAEPEELSRCVKCGKRCCPECCEWSGDEDDDACGDFFCLDCIEKAREGVKVNKTLRAYAKKHGLRLVTFAFKTQRGGVVEFEGCVTVEDSARLSEVLREINDLCDKAEKAMQP